MFVWRHIVCPTQCVSGSRMCVWSRTVNLETKCVCGYGDTMCDWKHKVCLETPCVSDAACVWTPCVSGEAMCNWRHNVCQTQCVSGDTMCVCTQCVSGDMCVCVCVIGLPLSLGGIPINAQLNDFDRPVTAYRPVTPIAPSRSSVRVRARAGQSNV